jgi:class 3 adenylate cyclase/tetratricopeptide (TPR) repeat protein
MSAKPSETAVSPKGERHRLTVLFSDLVGSTVLGREMESEHFSELLGKLREIWHQAAVKHGGHVIRTQGDGALAIFGYPRSGEDDSRRAAEAALDIHEWVSQVQHDGVPPARLPLRMHSGIHAGTLLLSEGDIEWGRFDLVGDVVNTAAHLSRHAAPGQILATLDALGPNANFFELGEGPGNAGPEFGFCEMCAVLGRSSVTRRFQATARRGLTPFIGRDKVATFLTDFLGTPSPAARKCVIVVGGPGLGKTRLLEEVLHQHDGDALTVIRGSCESYLGAEVLQPFLQILRAFFGMQADMSEDEAAMAARTALQPWIAELGPRAESILALVSGGAEAGGGRFTASGVVGDLLVFFAAVSAKAPLMLVIDDWQWADDASRQLMEALLQLTAGPRFILASRPRDDGAEWISGAPHLSLEPFQGTETDLAVRRWVPHADPFTVARIHSYAGGVPLFIEELCHSVSAGNPSHSLEGRGTHGWVATLVASRLARLPPEQVNVVRAAAVIGNAVPNWLLVSACGGAPDQATVRALADADFLYAAPAAGGLRFKHGITRDAVYESIGLRERQALHERVEIALLARSEQTDREDTLEALAHHSRGAGHWENAAHYAERAGDKAMAAFALDRARAQYQVAMETLDRVPHRTREQSLRWCLLANKLGMVSIFDPLSLSDDVNIFERAVTLARSLGEASAITRAHYWLGYMCYGFGRFRDGEYHARQALTLARESGDLRLAAQIEASLGQILAATCQYDQSITILDKAVSAKQQRSRPGGGIAIGSAYALSCKASVLADRGEFGDAQVCLGEAMALLGESTHPVANSVRNWVAVSLVWQGRWEEAERVAAESARIAENTQALLLLVVCRAAAGFARWARTGNAAGLQQLRDAVQWNEARGGQFYTSLYYGWLVEACAAEGDIVSARRYTARVLRRAREGERLGEAVASRAMAQIAAARDDFAASQRWLRRADKSAELRGSPREAALNQIVRGEILARQGHAEAACRTMAEAAAQLNALGMHWHAAQATRGLEPTVAVSGP